MPSWPGSLPQPLAGSFTETPARNVIRTQMDQGPAKVRLRTTAGVVELALTYLLDASELGTLNSFFTGDANYGATSFSFTHPRTGASVTCRFIEPPLYSSVNGLHYQAAVKLEVLPA